MDICLMIGDHEKRQSEKGSGRHFMQHPRTLKRYLYY